MIQFFCVGTYSEPILFGTGEILQGKGIGVYICSFVDGEIKVLDTLAQRNPSFVCLNEAKRKIYVVNELKEYLGVYGGGITEIDYNLKGEMKTVRSFNTNGTDSCHVAISPNFSFISVSNFASGSISIFPLNENGEILPLKAFFQHEGSSVHPIRQKGPHAHSSIFWKNKNIILVPDLGIDSVVCYEYDENGIYPRNELHVSPGSGPRFGEFDEDEKEFYLINEIGSSVTHFSVQEGKMTQKETISTLPIGFNGDNICSDLHIIPNGKHLYASNRGHNSIVCYKIGEDGILEFVQRISCGGKTPRNFAIDPTGKYLLVGNQDSDSIAVFCIKEDGCLTFQSKCEFPTPVCIKFFLNATFQT